MDDDDSDLTLLAFIAAAISAVVGRGPRQAFALGFVLAAAVYAAVMVADGKLSPRPGRLVTSQLLSSFYGAVTETVYRRWGSGQELRRDQLPADALVTRLGHSVDFPNPRPVFSKVVTPDRLHFTAVGHCLWALLLGYVGGHFARFVYARRVREQIAM